MYNYTDPERQKHRSRISILTIHVLCRYGVVIKERVIESVQDILSCIMPWQRRNCQRMRVCSRFEHMVDGNS